MLSRTPTYTPRHHPHLHFRVGRVGMLSRTPTYTPHHHHPSLRFFQKQFHRTGPRSCWGEEEGLRAAALSSLSRVA